MSNSQIPTSLHRLHRLSQSTQSSQAKRCPVECCCFVIFTQTRRRHIPRLFKKMRYHRKVSTKSTEFFGQIMFTFSQNTRPIHLIQSPLMQPRRTPMRYRRKQRLHLIQIIWQLFLRQSLVIRKQRLMRLPPSLWITLPQLPSKKLPHQGMTIHHRIIRITIQQLLPLQTLQHCFIHPVIHRWLVLMLNR